MATSTTLNKHLKDQKPTLSHLEYLDKILGAIHPVHIERVLDMRKTIELTLLKNPESKNQVVAYLSGVSDRLQVIWNNSQEKVSNEVHSIAC